MKKCENNISIIDQFIYKIVKRAGSIAKLRDDIKKQIDIQIGEFQQEVLTF